MALRQKSPKAHAEQSTSGNESERKKADRDRPHITSLVLTLGPLEGANNPDDIVQDYIFDDYCKNY